MLVTLSQRSKVFVKLLGIMIFLSTIDGRSQSNDTSNMIKMNLQQCVAYALENQPLVRQASLDEKISNKDIAISLSGWFPQVDVNASLQHYFTLPSFFIPDLSNPTGPKIKTTSGLINTSTAVFSATQSVYSTDLLYAGRSVRKLRHLSKQNAENVRINTIVSVNKAFWDLLLTEEQVGVLSEDIQRLERNYKDAFHLYENGLTDKTDYQQATIALNNARSGEKNTEEQIRVKYSVLKQQMGYPAEQPLKIAYDSSLLINEINADTTAAPQFTNRIEYQILESNLNLQKELTGYYRWSFLPSVSAFYDYNLIFQNDRFSRLYQLDYPNSLIGLKLTLPIFHGTSRLQNMYKSSLQYQRLQSGEELLKSQISTEYSQSLGSYKSNLYALKMARLNMDLARDVFTTVILQYNEGVKKYLDVIIADTDLKTAELNYLSSLFQVLSSKLELQKALGTISPY